MKILNTLFCILMFATPAIGGTLSCNIVAKLGQIESSQNGFWEEFGNLSSNPSGLDDAAVENLIRKHISQGPTQEDITRIRSPAGAPAQKVPSKPKIDISHAADKHVQKLPQDIMRKFQEFVDHISNANLNDRNMGFHGGWKFEPLQTGGFSVRLNQGYRVVFRVVNSQVQVIDVGKHVYKH